MFGVLTWAYLPLEWSTIPTGLIIVAVYTDLFILAVTVCCVVNSTAQRVIC